MLLKTKSQDKVSELQSSASRLCRTVGRKRKSAPDKEISSCACNSTCGHLLHVLYTAVHTCTCPNTHFRYFTYIHMWQFTLRNFMGPKTGGLPLLMKEWDNVKTHLES